MPCESASKTDKINPFICALGIDFLARIGCIAQKIAACVRCDYQPPARASGFTAIKKL
jgi:hypothetical protein